MLRRRVSPDGPGEPDRRRLLSAASGRREHAEALLADVRAAAAHGTTRDRRAALDQLLHAPPRLWCDLERAARRTPWGHPRPPNGIRTADPLHLVLASFDADGRLRQAAVERLAGHSGPYAAAALALRTDDWVAEVREPAVAALLTHVAPDEAAAAVRLLTRLERRSRCAGVLAAYRAALADPERRRSVRRLAADPDARVRRFGIELALELGEYVRGDLARTALHDPDRVCRALCATRLLELDPDQAGLLMWAPSAAVRELAVAALPDDVPAWRLAVPLADRARMVRAQARWKLYKRGEPPVDVYRRQLRRCARTTQPQVVAGLAAGLGECGDASDAAMLGVLAGDAGWAPVVRRAAVRALGRVGRPEDVQRVAPPLAAEEAPGLAREALDALAAVGGTPPQVLRAALDRPEVPVRKAALRAVHTADHWSRLELALAAAADPRPEVAERARGEVHAWIRTPWTAAPDAEQERRIADSLRSARLPPVDRDGVARVLHALGRRAPARRRP